MPRDVATQQTVEILTALKKLGEVLTPAEEAYLQTHSSSSLRAFEEVSSDIGEIRLFEGKTFLQSLFFKNEIFIKKKRISVGLFYPRVLNCAAINVTVSPVSWFSLPQVLDTRTTS